MFGEFAQGRVRDISPLLQYRRSLRRRATCRDIRAARREFGRAFQILSGRDGRVFPASFAFFGARFFNKSESCAEKRLAPFHAARKTLADAPIFLQGDVVVFMA